MGVFLGRQFQKLKIPHMHFLLALRYFRANQKRAFQIVLEDLELVRLPKLVRVVRVVKKVRVPTRSHSKVNFVCNDFALDSECSVLISVYDTGKNEKWSHLI